MFAYKNSLYSTAKTWMGCISTLEIWLVLYMLYIVEIWLVLYMLYIVEIWLVLYMLYIVEI
jgi:hypothetical protein